MHNFKKLNQTGKYDILYQLISKVKKILFSHGNLLMLCCCKNEVVPHEHVSFPASQPIAPTIVCEDNAGTQSCSYML